MVELNIGQIALWLINLILINVNNFILININFVVDGCSLVRFGTLLLKWRNRWCGGLVYYSLVT